jgi:hypothetical protein
MSVLGLSHVNPIESPSFLTESGIPIANDPWPHPQRGHSIAKARRNQKLRAWQFIHVPFLDSFPNITQINELTSIQSIAGQRESLQMPNRAQHVVAIHLDWKLR